MPEIYVGLGSNVEPLIHLGEALGGMQDAFGPLSMSSVYQNKPVGFSGADFLNLVVGFKSQLPPPEIVVVLSALEESSGRVRTGPILGSRELDLDLLLYGSMVDPDRKLPRSDVLRYAFVLGPLAELAPALVHPVTGQAFNGAWQKMSLREQPLKRLSGDSSRIRPLLEFSLKK